MKNRKLIVELEELGLDTIPDSWYDNDVFTMAEYDRYQAENDYKFLSDNTEIDLSKLSDSELTELVNELAENELDMEAGAAVFETLLEELDVVFYEADQEAQRTVFGKAEKIKNSFH